jgi:hypothetical protein
MLKKNVNIHEIIGLWYGFETRNEAIVRYSEDVDAVLYHFLATKTLCLDCSNSFDAVQET